MNQQELFGKPKPVVLELKGTVPSFKNSKMLITKSPQGRPLQRPMLITKPEFQELMEQITESFRSQLLSAIQTGSGEILTAQQRRSLIALCVPDDDCWTRIIDLRIVSALDAENPGATITLQRL